MGTDSTLTNEIYNELYRAITHQELKPGQNLTLTMLKKQFNVSHTPIREALTRLSADGLVTYHPNKGMKVTDFSEVKSGKSSSSPPNWKCWPFASAAVPSPWRR